MSKKHPPAGIRTPTKQTASHPTIALALGGGGARGLAHIQILDAKHEHGEPPTINAGTSCGAVVAAADAAGLSCNQIRALAFEVLRKRLDLVRELFAARARA